MAALALPARPEPASEKPTTRAPPPLMNERRENSRSCCKPVMSCPRFRHDRGCLLDRGEDAWVGAATAQVPVHRRPDLILGRVLGGGQQVGGLDHHPVLAVAAVWHLDVDP